MPRPSGLRKGSMWSWFPARPSRSWTVVARDRLSNSVSGKALTKVRHDYLMFYTEDGLGQRRERVRGMINQVETLSIFTFNGMTMAKKTSKHFTGSNYGNVIGPLSTMAYDDKDCWILDPAGKKALYGPSGKTLAGGAVPDAPPRPQVAGI